MLNLTLAERIKVLRNHLNLNQQEFGKRLGCSLRQISSYELGQAAPSITILTKIVNEFSVNYKWLSEGTGDMFNMEKINQDQIAAVENDNDFSLDEKAQQNLNKIRGLNNMQEPGRAYISNGKISVITTEYVAELLEKLEEKEQQKVFLKLIINWQPENLIKLVKIMSDIMEFRGDHKKT